MSLTYPQRELAVVTSSSVGDGVCRWLRRGLWLFVNVSGQRCGNAALRGSVRAALDRLGRWTQAPAGALPVEASA